MNYDQWRLYHPMHDEPDPINICDECGYQGQQEPGDVCEECAHGTITAHDALDPYRYPQEA